ALANIFGIPVAEVEAELQREVSTSEGLALAERHGMLFAEVSCKNGDGVQQALRSLVDSLLGDTVVKGQVLAAPLVRPDMDKIKRLRPSNAKTTSAVAGTSDTWQSKKSCLPEQRPSSTKCNLQ